MARIGRLRSPHFAPDLGAAAPNSPAGPVLREEARKWRVSAACDRPILRRIWAPRRRIPRPGRFCERRRANGAYRPPAIAGTGVKLLTRVYARIGRLRSPRFAPDPPHYILAGASMPIRPSAFFRADMNDATRQRRELDRSASDASMTLTCS